MLQLGQIWARCSALHQLMHIPVGKAARSGLPLTRALTGPGGYVAQPIPLCPQALLSCALVGATAWSGDVEEPLLRASLLG